MFIVWVGIVNLFDKGYGCLILLWGKSEELGIIMNLLCDKSKI